MNPITPDRPSNPLVSLIVPVYNEEDALPKFLEVTTDVLDKNQLDHEYIFINDGSTDSTLPLLVSLSASNSKIKVVNLSRNFGKEAALTAGIDHAKGNVVIPIDVDLQDPPQLIPEFIEKWREGFDVVYGIRIRRDKDSLSKRTTSSWFYRIFNKLSPLSIPENAGDFRLMDEKVIAVLKQLPERNRFMKGLFSWVGFQSTGINYERPGRVAGETKWRFQKLWNFALDGIVSFSTLPLRVWSYIGLIISLMSFFYAMIVVSRVLIFGKDLPGYASLITIILFLGGIQLISLGVIGEYLARIFDEAKERPVYVVDRIYDADSLASATPPESDDLPA